MNFKVGNYLAVLLLQTVGAMFRLINLALIFVTTMHVS